MDTIEKTSLYTDLTAEESSQVNGGAPVLDMEAFGAFFPLYLIAHAAAAPPKTPFIQIVGKALLDTLNKTAYSSLALNPFFSPVSW